jgi:DNA-binding XRE family transcriptional regulator
MWFRHLDYAPGTAPDDLGPAAIDDLLDRGDLEAWTPLLRAAGKDPWGPLAETILRLCDAHSMYGTSTLWRTWIERRRQPEAAPGSTLAEARSRTGLTQTQVAERLGISQSDVSKLERRADMRLSTLRAYAGAIGFRLHVALAGPGDEAPRPLVTPEPRGGRRGRSRKG